MENEPERGVRRTMSFDMRFERTALYAHEHGFPVITSSLGISRWKNMQQINDCGKRAASHYLFRWRSYLSEPEHGSCGRIQRSWYPSRDEAMLSAQLRSDGSVAAVYYDPAHPCHSVLDRQTTGNGNADGVISTLSVVLMMFPVGALVLIYISWKKRKQIDQQLIERVETL